jgi:hypothetical protein
VVGVASPCETRAAARIALARIGVTGMGARAFRARNAEALLEGGRGRGSSGGGGGRGRGGQLRPVRSGRIPAASGAGTRGARDCGGPDEGVVKVSGAYRLAMPRRARLRAVTGPGNSGTLHAGVRKLGQDGRRRVRACA